MDTLAATYAQMADFDQAVHWQEKAVALAPSQQQPELQKRLDLYRSERPPP